MVLFIFTVRKKVYKKEVQILFYTIVWFCCIVSDAYFSYLKIYCYFEIYAMNFKVFIFKRKINTAIYDNYCIGFQRFQMKV